MPLSTISNGESGLSARNKINAGFAAIDSIQSSAYVTTTTGATATAVTLSMGTYSVYSIEATISAWDNSNTLAYGSQVFGVFYNNGLSINQVSTTDIFEKSGFSTATSHIIVDTDPKIVVIGESSKTINWNINYSVTKI